MNCIRLVVTDLKAGGKKPVRFIALGVISLCVCLMFNELVSDLAEYISGDELTLADCLAFFWKGNYPFSGRLMEDEFVIPVPWMAVNIFVLIIPLDYPARSMQLWGYPYMIKAGKRSWWISKVIYTFIMDILSFMVMYSVILAMCLFNHYRIGFDNNYYLYDLLFGEVEAAYNASLPVLENLCLLALLPFAGLAAISMLQLLISVFVNPVIAFMLSLVILVFSVYDNKIWLPGNYMMAIRSSLIDSYGIPPLDGITMCIVIIISVVLGGLFMIRKTELTGTDGDR